ncbi:MAG TPA: adenylate/guanylate cyclase domain-containing protein [Dongiaceae bacterium]|nr:adenylate/guanylate cyclase domain-containing protein [Dongiaceae bacterium]
MDRRLATIVAVDVVGYTRLMEADEAGTLALLKSRRRELLKPLAERHGGRLFKVMGDGVLLDFSSPVQAVAFAAELHRDFDTANVALPEARRIVVRIGINVGDVIIEGADLYGDGVNLAARLQGLAAPGGICISAAVHEQVAGKVPLSFDDIGAPAMKNIARPVQAFHAVVGQAPPGIEVGRRPGATRPSIAVMPFNNFSGDPEQEFFVDGLTEDTITELSRFHDLLVISRNSSFKYKGKAIDVQKVGRELNVQYIVEGSVRKAGDRVRINVQLIDAETDRHIWAERYDREIADIFAIQDDVTSAIVAILPGRIEAATRARAEHKPTESMAAFECVMSARLLHHRSTRQDNTSAMGMIDRAIALDPNYAHARAWRACILGQSWSNGYCQDREATWNEVVAELQAAAALDDNDSDVHRIYAAVNIASDNLDRAAYHQERALSLNPNDDLIVVQQGELLTWLGRAEEGADWIRKAMRLNPYHPQRFWNHLGRAWFVAHRYPDAIDAFSRISPLDTAHHAFLAASRAMLGERDAAAQDVARLLAQDPAFAIDTHLRAMHYRRPEDLQHHREALLRAGLPEG